MLPSRKAKKIHLRTVIVTAAVHQGFDSQREPILLTFWHWAGVSPYTSTCVLAETCVFDKQLQGIFRCGLRKRRQSLSRSYGRCYAEFLKLSYLERLSILNPSTSVSLRYGRLNHKFRRFSRHRNHRFVADSRRRMRASLLANSSGFAYSSINLKFAPEFINRKRNFPDASRHH